MITTINEFKHQLNEEIKIPYGFSQLTDINGNTYSFNEIGTTLIINNNNFFTYSNLGVFKNKSPKVYGRGVLSKPTLDKTTLRGSNISVNFETFMDVLLEAPLDSIISTELDLLLPKLKNFLEIK